MESNELLREVYGLDPSEFTFERYRTAEQGVNENGRACRVSHRSGNVVCSERARTYHENLNLALVVAASNLALVGEKRVNKPIEELLAEYENECCDFEDGKWMAQAALRYEPSMADSQLRCLVFGLANIVAGTPYRRPKTAKVPVQQVEELATWLKRNKQPLLARLKKDLEVDDLTFTVSMRTSKLQSGIVKRLYGHIDLKSSARCNMRAVYRQIATIINEMADTDYTPAFYTTTGSTSSMGFNAKFRIVCKGEEDYDTWIKYHAIYV